MHGLEDAGPHRGKIGDGAPHLGVHPLEPGDQLLAQGAVLDGIEMQMDEALAPFARLQLALGFSFQLDERPGGVAVDAEDGVSDEPQAEPVLGDLGERGVKQERHVVIDRLDDRHLVHAAVVAGHVSQGDARLASGARLGEHR